MARIRTLLACWDEATEIAVKTLGPQFSVSVAHTLVEAEHQLQTQRYDLIVATIRFDESRPLDLMPLVKQHDAPLALVRFGVSKLPKELVEAVFLAARSLGCSATFDLAVRSRLLGPEAALAEMRMVLRASARTPDKDAPAAGTMMMRTSSNAPPFH